MDPDVASKHRQRYKVPPGRIPADQMDAETFKEILAEQERQAAEIQLSKEEEAKEMTKELFMEIYNDPLAKQRRKALSEKERMLNQMEYFQITDERIWLDDQMIILEQYLDRHRLKGQVEAWETWFRGYTERCEKSAKKIAQIHGRDKAIAWMKFAWKIGQEKKPTDVQPFTKIIRRRVRRLALGTDMEALRSFTEELRPLLGKAAEEAKPKLKKKPRKKKSKGLPKGKFPLPGIHDKKEE